MRGLSFRSALFFVVPFFLSIIAFKALARENVTDWYIKDFSSVITVNRDSSLDVTETIVADCGEAEDKHGIFRVLPYEIKVAGKGIIKTPIELISITDESGVAYEYNESRSKFDKTVTWKIGSANKTVQGVNVYIIKYHVDNAIRSWGAEKDELYWNLTGNFWDLEIDRARVKLVFPLEVSESNSPVYLYSGTQGNKGNEYADYRWLGDNEVEFLSTRMLPVRTGITASISFPKGVFVAYKESFMDEYGEFLYYLIPMAVFLSCLFAWRRYGRDPKIDKAVIAEYGIPGELSPLEMGLLMGNGNLKNDYVTAEIIQFGAKGVISIREIKEKALFINTTEYELTRLGDKEAEGKLNDAEMMILEKLFEKGDKVELSEMQKNFYKILGKVRSQGIKQLSAKALIVPDSLKFRVAFLLFGGLLVFAGFLLLQGGMSLHPSFALFVSGAIIFFFSFIMPRRTQAGAEIFHQVKGFKLFMETVDKDRAAFYEKENIFEKFLPYAILFGITGLWIKRIKEIYGEEYIASHAPAWYVGSHIGSFDADSFSKSMTDLSHGIAASTSAPSGSGGAGSAGGGGGGGGGGGW